MTTVTERRGSVDVRTLAADGTVAVVGSVAANVALLWVVLATDAVAPFMALAYPPVAFLTAVGAVGATIVYGFLASRRADPDRTFVRVAVAVLVLSFLPDVAILAFDEAATPGAVAVLAAMHVVVAAICVAVFSR